MAKIGEADEEKMIKTIKEKVTSMKEKGITLSPKSNPQVNWPVKRGVPRIQSLDIKNEAAKQNATPELKQVVFPEKKITPELSTKSSPPPQKSFSSIPWKMLKLPKIKSNFVLLFGVIVIGIVLLAILSLNFVKSETEYSFKVVNQDGEAVESAVVTVISGDKIFETLTDAEGKFSIKLPSENATVIARKDGFDLFYEEFVLTPGSISQVVLSVIQQQEIVVPEIIEEILPPVQLDDECEWTLDLDNFASEAKPRATQAREYNSCYTDKFMLKVKSTTTPKFCNSIVDDKFLVSCFSLLARKTNDVTVCDDITQRIISVSGFSQDVSTKDACYYQYLIDYNQLIGEGEETVACESIENESFKAFCLVKARSEN